MHGDSDPTSASTAPAQDTSSTFIPGITSNKPTTSLEAPSSSQQEPNNSHTASPETPSVSRLSTLNLYSTFKLRYHFSSEYLNNVSVRDASTLLGCDNGWPSVFEVKEVTCQICGEPLGTSKIHSGMRGGSILYTNLNPFKDVVKVKECTSVEFRAMHRVCPSEEGIIIMFVFILIKLISFEIAYNFTQNNHKILYCCIRGVVGLVDIFFTFFKGSDQLLWP